MNALVKASQLEEAQQLLEHMLRALLPPPTTRSAPPLSQGRAARSRRMTQSAAQQSLFQVGPPASASSTPVQPGDSVAAQQVEPTAGAAAESLAHEVWVRRMLAELLLRGKDTEAAAPHLSWLLQHMPEDPRVLLLSAERHRLEGHPEQALPLFRDSLALQEQSFVRARLIDVLLQLERYGEAEAELKRALDRAPGDPYLLRRQARLLAQTGRTAQAAETFTLLAGSASGGSQRDYAEAVRLKLEPLEPAQRLNELRHLLQVPSRRENPWLMVLAAEQALEQGAKEEGRAHLDRVLAAGPTDPFLCRRLGFAYNRLGRYAEVLSTLGVAFVHDPRDLVCQQVLLAAGKKSQHLQELRTCLMLAYERHPTFHKLSGLIKKVTHLLESPGKGEAP